MCPTLENLVLVYQETGDSQSLTHSRPDEHGSRQAIQARPGHSDRVVSPSRAFSKDMQQVARTSNRSICHEVQQQVASICVTGTEPHGLSSGCTQPAMGGSGLVISTGIRISGYPNPEYLPESEITYPSTRI